jgi:hypothetical protein
MSDLSVKPAASWQDIVGKKNLDPYGETLMEDIAGDHSI